MTETKAGIDNGGVDTMEMRTRKEPKYGIVEGPHPMQSVVQEYPARATRQTDPLAPSMNEAPLKPA